MRPADAPDMSVALVINAAWCKGCDICVKLCPERCLALDAEQVAFLKAPHACTGCRVCEWLCPDFAIEVRDGRASADDALQNDNPSLAALHGNRACALAAIAAGCRFFAGYPITPSSEIAEQLSRELPRVDGVFIQMEDEIGSLAAVIGASLGGVKVMTATSGPGFSLMQENLGYAAMTETPCVIVNVMRGGPSTGMPTRPSQGDIMQARWGTHGDHPIVVLAPASVQEIYDETIRAFNLAEEFRTPVIVALRRDDRASARVRRHPAAPHGGDGHAQICARRRARLPALRRDRGPRAADGAPGRRSSRPRDRPHPYGRRLPDPEARPRRAGRRGGFSTRSNRTATASSGPRHSRSRTPRF